MNYTIFEERVIEYYKQNQLIITKQYILGKDPYVYMLNSNFNIKELKEISEDITKNNPYHAMLPKILNFILKKENFNDVEYL